jgi:chromosome condensin MukBEF complex kleisin-like MukF subunit
MPIWGYILLFVFLMSLVLLTFRRNAHVTHSAAPEYGADFRMVLDEAEPVMTDLRQALRAGEERPLARAAAAARSVIHAHISNLDRLGIPETIPDEEQAVLEEIRRRLRQAMENYEWAARIAETTDLLENTGLRHGFDTLAGAGDQLCAQARFELVALVPG